MPCIRPYYSDGGRRRVRGVVANLDEVGIERIRRDSKVIVALVLVGLVSTTVFQFARIYKGAYLSCRPPKDVT